jgi:hypothetical protein
MNRILTACSIAALSTLTATAQAQTGSMSSPMNSSQGAMAQPQTGGQMSEGRMAELNTKKHKKPQVPNAMSGGNMNGPASSGAMGAQSTSNSNSMSSPH